MIKWQSSAGGLTVNMGLLKLADLDILHVGRMMFLDQDHLIIRV